MISYVVEWDADAVLDATQALTYSISTQTIPGAFAIDADNGQISVADGSLLNFESNATHALTVRVIDVDGNTHDEAFAVSLRNLVELAQTVPDAQNVDEDQTLTFSAGNGNGLSVSDTEAATNTPMQVTLSVNDGVLNLSALTGITLVEGATGSSFITFNGTESDINTALEGMTFTPDMNFNGSVTLNMTTALAADLEGQYTFEVDASDQSIGTAQDGTLVGNATTFTDSTRGEVLSLDGVNDAVQINGTFS
ncbi:MAG: hypothetical protein ACI8W7_002381, partial [Gammaproteobacteria bacterium]